MHFGHVGGATELFEALKSQEERFDFEMLHYFSSHPELQNRIDDLHRLAQERGLSINETKDLAL